MFATHHCRRLCLAMVCGAVALLGIRDTSTTIAADAPANDPADLRRYADVKEWVGQINYAYTSSWDEQLGTGHITGSAVERGTIQLHCDQMTLPSAGINWRGDGSVHSTFSLNSRLTGKGLVMTESRSGGAHFKTPNNWVEMELDKKTFRAGAGGGTPLPYEARYSSSAAGITRSWKEKASFTPGSARALEEEPLPPPGKSGPLIGSNRIVGDPNGAGRVAGIGKIMGIQKPKRVLEMNWTLSPVWSDVELVVDIDDYDAWIPQGDLPSNGTVPGNKLTARATLQTRDGKAPQVPAKSIQFELLETSREPGVCMNWPPDAPRVETDEPFDLRMDVADNKTLSPGDDTFQTAKAQAGDGKLTTATAVIACYDYGAWSDLRVTAELQDGRIVVGHLRNEQSTLRISIPKRTGGSRIADAYRKTLPASADVADDVDDEHTANNDNDGDGFSAYEEYRGFSLAARHLRTTPGMKDLFIRDRIGGQSVRGFRIFERATSIITRWQLLEEEMRPDRAMNFNRSARTPVASDQLQHAIIVRQWEKKGSSKMESDLGKPCLPKHCKYVSISKAISPFEGSYTSPYRDNRYLRCDESGATIAHEIAHACCTWHHGEIDHGPRFWVVDRTATPAVIRECSVGEDGKIARDPKDPTKRETGSIVRLFREDRSEVLPTDERLTKPLRVYIAESKAGPHSGNEACFMRYDCATAYLHPRGPANARVWFSDGEFTGEQLCDSPAGTGVNLAARTPWPRYGNAAAASVGGPKPRGNCKAQVNINDASGP